MRVFKEAFSQFTGDDPVLSVLTLASLAGLLWMAGAYLFA